ncbi:MAG: nucleotide exchange factor GrpE [Myxococcota bacterium]
MSSKRNAPNDLDRAMQDALESVEGRERATAEMNDEATVADTVDDPELAETRAALETKTAELATMRDQMLRLGADFENLRKRSHREVDEARKMGMERLARDILPVVDNLERALQHAKAGDPVVDGVRMVAKQFLDILGQFGVKAFDSVGQPFDPERHEALSQISTPGAAPGTIVAEMQRGYMIHDRLLRAAQVAIASAQTDASADAAFDA